MRLRAVNYEETGYILMMGAEIEVLEPTLFSYLVYYKAPFTGGGETLLPPGERVVVSGLPGIRLAKGGKVMKLMGHSAYFHFIDPAKEALYIDPVVWVLEHMKEHTRTLYSGYVYTLRQRFKLIGQ